MVPEKSTPSLCKNESGEFDIAVHGTPLAACSAAHRKTAIDDTRLGDWGICPPSSVGLIGIVEKPYPSVASGNSRVLSLPRKVRMILNEGHEWDII